MSSRASTIAVGKYVVAQLALIYELRTRKNDGGNPIAQGVGLGSGTAFSDHQGKRASGADVMQCWALLLNTGHLDGTFAAEEGCSAS